MEMQDISPEKENAKEDEGADEAVPDVKTKALEEEEPEHYSELQSPPEDVYSEARFYNPPAKTKTGKQTEGNARLYRVGCLLLAMISLVLLLVVIILGLKLQNGSTVCPVTEETLVTSKAPTCSYEQCQALFPSLLTRRLGCQQCADGWLTFGQSCFYLSTFRLTWDESRRNCSSRGASLAIITSESAQNYLTRKGGLKYWMGLKLKGDTWTWVNNDVLQKSYWAEGDWPQQDCGILNSKGPSEKNWITASCTSKTYFICQVEF